MVRCARKYLERATQVCRAACRLANTSSSLSTISASSSTFRMARVLIWRLYHNPLASERKQNENKGIIQWRVKDAEKSAYHIVEFPKTVLVVKEFQNDTESKCHAKEHGCMASATLMSTFQHPQFTPGKGRYWYMYNTNSHIAMNSNLTSWLKTLCDKRHTCHENAEWRNESKDNQSHAEVISPSPWYPQSKPGNRDTLIRRWRQLRDGEQPASAAHPHDWWTLLQTSCGTEEKPSTTRKD
jgi:hypothetical protein